MAIEIASTNPEQIEIPNNDNRIFIASLENPIGATIDLWMSESENGNPMDRINMSIEHISSNRKDITIYCDADNVDDSKCDIVHFLVIQSAGNKGSRRCIKILKAVP